MVGRRTSLCRDDSVHIASCVLSVNAWKLTPCSVTWSSRSAVYRMNRRGPSTEPCGTLTVNWHFHSHYTGDQHYSLQLGLLFSRVLCSSLVKISLRPTKLLGAQVHEPMHVIISGSGNLLSTPFPWLPALSSIPVPHLRCQD